MATGTTALVGSLPIHRTRLIGREAEAAAGRTFLVDDGVPLLTLTGPGGVGKTRLALAIVADLADRFPDGVVWIDLAPLADPTLVPATIVRALGLAPPRGMRALDALVRDLHARQVLLLCDNCEHVLETTAELLSPLLAACPAVQVLATSRAPLRLQAERLLPVEPLALPTSDHQPLAMLAQNDAVCLFVERARAVRPAFRLNDENALNIAAICRHLDGLPLAIELAAARSAIYPPAALLAQMSDRLRLLRGGARDAPARQRTMREAIAWSHDLLTPAQQACFRRLAVVAGGCTAEAAQAMIGSDVATADDLLDTLEALIAASLLRVEAATGPLRFGMFETIREFALEQLAASGEEEGARDRHAAWFLNFATGSAPGIRAMTDAAFIRRLGDEHQNLRAALHWFAARHDAESLAQLVGALTWLWWMGGFIGEGRSWQDAALAAGASLAPKTRQAVLFGAAELAIQQNDHARAEALGKELLASARDARDRGNEALAQLALSRAANQRGDGAQALALAEEGVALRRALGDDEWLPWAVQRLGVEFHAAGDPERAAVLFTEALQRFRAMNNTIGIAYALTNLGNAHFAMGDPRQAASLYRERLLLHPEMQDPWETAEALDLVAALAAEAGASERAASLLGASGVLYHSSGTNPQPYGHRVVDRLASRVQERLGPEPFQASRDAGSALSLAQAATYALETLATIEADLRGAGPPPPPPFGLTPREEEVLRLLVAGRSNPQIAEALFISRATARTHVANILGKLGVTSRTEAADLAHRRGLV